MTGLQVELLYFAVFQCSRLIFSGFSKTKIEVTPLKNKLTIVDNGKRQKT